MREILKFFILFLGAWLEMKKEKREQEQAQLTADQEFDLMLEKVLARCGKNTKLESKEAQKIEDHIDS